MATMRHWQQRWTPGAKLVFRRRMVLGCCGVDVVHPGDPVTPEMLAFFGNRMRRWWDAGHVEMAEWPPEVASKASEPVDPPVPAVDAVDPVDAVVDAPEADHAPAKKKARKKKAHRPSHG